MSEKLLARIKTESPTKFAVTFEGGKFNGRTLIVELEKLPPMSDEINYPYLLREVILDTEEMKEAKELGYEVLTSDLIIPWER
jgi:predicted RNA-binding protein with EMAP domain